MSDNLPNLEVRRALVFKLTAAFPTKRDVADLVELYLGRPIDQFHTDGDDTQSRIRGVLNWCDSQGGNMLQVLLEGVLVERPHNHDLHTIVAQFGVKSSGTQSARRAIRPTSALKSADVELDNATLFL